MRNKLGILVALVLLGLLVGCAAISEVAPDVIAGSGNVVTEEREVSGFTSVALDGFGRLEIDQTGRESLSITADDNLLPYIETAVRGDTLVISMKDETVFRDFDDLTFNVTAEALDSLEVNGAGEIVVLNLDGQAWRATLDGGASINVSGTVDQQTVEINGAGSYNAENLESREASLEHNGAGLILVRVSDQLEVVINGAGIVEYIGNPAVTQEINGLGIVRQR